MHANEFMNDYVGKWVALREKVSSKEYQDWLVSILEKEKGISDESYLYDKDVEETTKENAEILSHFHSFVERLAKEQCIQEVIDDGSSIYYFKLKGRYYQTETFFGQGAITFVSNDEFDENKDYVLIDEPVDEDLIESRELVHIIVFGSKETSLRERMRTCVKLTSMLCDNAYVDVSLETWKKGTNKKTLFFEGNDDTLKELKEKYDNICEEDEDGNILAIDLKILQIGKFFEENKHKMGKTLTIFP